MFDPLKPGVRNSDPIGLNVFILLSSLTAQTKIYLEIKDPEINGPREQDFSLVGL